MKKQIAACIKQMSGKYAPQVVFADWIQCVALSISNSAQIFHDNLWRQREEQYLATMNRYGKEERMKMAEMAGMLILTYEKGLGDVLGEVYMESIGGNKNSGQFFTPYHVSLITARLTLPDVIDESKKLSLGDKAVARLIQGIPQKGLISGLFADGRPMRSYFFALPPVR